MSGHISIIMPVLNEEANIAAALEALSEARAGGVQVIVADGGSTDSTVSRALPHCDLLVTAPRGRAAQMNAGASQAEGAIMAFLHADTRLPDGWQGAIRSAMANRSHHWGRFDVAIEGRPPMLRVIAAAMNLRSRLTGIATGDQAMFMRREIFERTGGFPDIPLMEDIAMSRRLKQASAPACLRAKVTTSGRRWEKHGIWRTVLTMWRLRAAYYFGADPVKLASRYGYAPRQEQ